MGVMALNYLALGITLPAMSLIVVSKGYPLTTLALIMMIYSATVMVFEVPSGLFADAKGRKTSFIFGIALSTLGVGCMFAQNLMVICTGFALSGAGRAYGSGSLDALFIEEGQVHGKRLETLVFALEINSGVSLSIGALIGGWLLTLGQEGPTLTYPILMVRISLLILSLLLVMISINEKQRLNHTHVTFFAQITLFKQLLGGTPFLLLFSMSVFLKGMLLSSVEGFWQPYLKNLLSNDSQYWILGAVASLIFGISVIGSLIGQKMVGLKNPVGIYSIMFLIIFGFQILLSLTQHTLSFLIVYCLIYLFLGGSSVVGEYILNKATKDEVRSSMLSLSSFSLQSGAIISNILATLTFLYGGIDLLWKLCAILGALGFVFLTKPMLQQFPSVTGQ